jgi:hypothetical protein
MREQEHNYEVNSLPLGFEIVPKDETRPTLTVTLNDKGFWTFSNSADYDVLPLYQFYSLVNTSVSKIYESWKSPKENQTYTPVHITRWMQTQTSKCLNHRILTEWQRMLNTVDPTLQKIHKRFFSLACGKGYWNSVQDVLNQNNPYIISDVLAYKSAAIAILFDNAQKWKKDWAYSFAKDETKYHSLMRTLMNMPSGILYGMTPNLKDVRLPEAALTPIRMMAYTSLPAPYYTDKAEEFIKVILRSTDDDIRKGIRLMWQYFPSTTTSGFKSKREILRAFTLIYDYAGEVGKWDMAGLARRSEQYHHDIAAQQRAQQEIWDRQRLADDKAYAERRKMLQTAKTALPSIPLPVDEHIRFLDTYVSVLDEGMLMEHCIAQYAERAVDGHSYLFHVDYNGEMASVEVSPRGFVSQSYGPKDRLNNASAYGKKVLTKWCKPLQKTVNSPMVTINENFGITAATEDIGFPF